MLEFISDQPVIEGEFQDMDPNQPDIALVVAAIREVSEALNRVATRQDRADGKHDEMLQLINQLHTRVTVIETGSVAPQIVALDKRMTALELANQLHAGERGVWAALLKSPVVGWVVAAAGAVWMFINSSNNAGAH